MEGVMSLRVKDFQTYIVHISDDVKCSNYKTFHAWIKFVKFNILFIINDLQCMEGDRNS